LPAARQQAARHPEAGSGSKSAASIRISRHLASMGHFLVVPPGGSGGDEQVRRKITGEQLQRAVGDYTNPIAALGSGSREEEG